MSYSYDSPEEAIISLELSYSNCDINGVVESKDFVGEAMFILKQAEHKFDITDRELINETANLLKLTLTKQLLEEGFPDFRDVKRFFSELVPINKNLFSIDEVLHYGDEIYNNKIYLSKIGRHWKVVSVESIDL